jgi:hypothetical protein
MAVYLKRRTQITVFFLEAKVLKKILRAWKDKMNNLRYFMMKNEVLLCPEHGFETSTYGTLMGKDHIS